MSLTIDPILSEYVIIMDGDDDRSAFERASLSLYVCDVGGYTLLTAEDRTSRVHLGIWRDPDAAREARDLILSGATGVRLTRCPEAP